MAERNEKAEGSNYEGLTKEEQEQKDLTENLARIGYKIIVLSGKGGVGKSTVATNLAVSLAGRGFRVGLLDVDIHGPSIPKLLGIEESKLMGTVHEKLVPVTYNDTLKVISIGFLINSQNDPVVWRGPLKYGVIKQFLKDVVWEDLDYLIIDSPPGTGDEPLSVCQLVEGEKGAVVVTTPQDVALLDVRKSVTFCEKLNVPVIGVVENMSGFTCPHCGKEVDVFKRGGGREMAEDMNVPFSGSIPLTADIVTGGDRGVPFLVESDESSNETVKKSFDQIVDSLLKVISR